jgi:hypothetical protein
MKKSNTLIILIILILPVLACGLVNPIDRSNNDVRLAVYKYAREKYGPFDDLVIDFKRGEPRIKFEGQDENGGHTVWLYAAGAKEYFAVRPPQATYLYIQKIEYNNEGNGAAVDIYYGNGQGYQGRRLTLTKDEQGHWTVTSDIEITTP